MPTLTGTLTAVTGGTIDTSRVRNAYVRAPQRRGSLGSEGGLVTSVPVPVPTSGELSLDLEPGPAILVVDTLDAGQDVFDLYVTADMTLLSEALAESAPPHERSWMESQLVQLRGETVDAAGTAISAAEQAALDRAEVEGLRENLVEAAEQNAAPHLTTSALNATYGTKVEVASKVSKTVADATYATKAELGSVIPDNVVTSPDFGVFRKTYDPNERAAPGELLILLQAVDRWTDFQDAPAGTLPAGWTARLHAAGHWYVHDGTVTGQTGNRSLRCQLATTDTNKVVGVSWDVFDGFADVEVVFRWRTSLTARPITSLLRADEDKNGYLLGQSTPTASRLVKLNTGVSATVLERPSVTITNTSGDWYLTRARVSGSEFKSRTWKSGTTEPSTWTVEATDDSHHVGWFGAAVSQGAAQTVSAYIDWIGMSNHGTAPSQAV